MKTFNIGDRVVIKTGKAAGRIGIIECQVLSGGNPMNYTVIFQKNGKPTRQQFHVDKLDLHRAGPELDESP